MKTLENKMAIANIEGKIEVLESQLTIGFADSVLTQLWINKLEELYAKLYKLLEKGIK